MEPGVQESIIYASPATLVRHSRSFEQFQDLGAKLYRYMQKTKP
jgi:hypothetical protein